MANLMEGGRWREKAEKFTSKLGKFRYPLLILLLGVILLLIPGKKTEANMEKSIAEENETSPQGQLLVEEARLSNLLSQVEGAGRVEVMLSMASGGETLYQTDIISTITTGDINENHRQESTLLYDADGNTQAPLVQKRTAPIYQGAVILCQGADNQEVKLALIQAVAGLTGLGTDRITVVKMH